MRIQASAVMVHTLDNFQMTNCKRDRSIDKALDNELHCIDRFPAGWFSDALMNILFGLDRAMCDPCRASAKGAANNALLGEASRVCLP